jgi:hypothetical protein
MQKQIITHFPQEINPFFKKIPELSSRGSDSGRTVKRVFSTTVRRHEKMHESGKSVVFGLSLLCKHFGVWKKLSTDGALVDNTCGEVCGECGKPHVFHSYSPQSPVDGSVEKSLTPHAQPPA